MDGNMPGENRTSNQILSATSAHIERANPLDNSITIGQIWRTTLRGWWLILLTGLVFVAVAIYHNRNADILYTVHMEVAPRSADDYVSSNRQFGVTTRLIGFSSSDPTLGRFKFYLKYLTSQTAIETLMQDDALLSEFNQWSRFANFDWDPQNEAWFAIEPGTVGAVLKFFFPDSPQSNTLTRDSVNAFLEDIVSVQTIDREINLVRISIEVPDPAIGVRLLKKLHKTADDKIRMQYQTNVKSQREYLQEYLNSNDEILRGEVLQLMRTTISKEMLAGSIDTFSVIQITPPNSTDLPTSPKYILNIIIASMLAIFFGAGLSFFMYQSRVHK